MEMMAREDFSPVAGMGLLISRAVQLTEGDWFVAREQPCSETTQPCLGSSCQLFHGLKKNQGSHDGTESLVPHEGVKESCA